MTHKLPVFSPLANRLIAEIVALGGRAEIEERYGLFYWGPPSFHHQLDSLHPIPTDLEAELDVLRQRLVGERRDQGWEVDRLLAVVLDDRGI